MASPCLNLEVAECFTTPGSHLKRNKIMGRGRFGVMHHKISHLRVVLREIDFCLKLYQARTPSEQKNWLEQYMMGQRDYEAAKVERDALDALRTHGCHATTGKDAKLKKTQKIRVDPAGHSTLRTVLATYRNHYADTK
jgi:hypothetical protein